MPTICGRARAMSRNRLFQADRSVVFETTRTVSLFAPRSEIRPSCFSLNACFIELAVVVDQIPSTGRCFMPRTKSRCSFVDMTPLWGWPYYFIDQRREVVPDRHLAQVFRMIEPVVQHHHALYARLGRRGQRTQALTASTARDQAHYGVHVVFYAVVNLLRRSSFRSVADFCSASLASHVVIVNSTP